MNIFTSPRREMVIVAVVSIFVAGASAQQRPVPPPIVTSYCSGCHGMDGRAKLPYVPRLAGQNTAYLEHKLSYFRTVASSPVDEAFVRIARIGGDASEHASLTDVAAVQMVGVANTVSERDLKAAAQWYSAQQPALGKHAKGKVIEEGRSLYSNGLQTQNLPACRQCHGPDGAGSDKAPRLAGQNAAYLLSQLTLFRHANAGRSPMTDVARCLETEQASAIAVYLQSR